MGVLIQIVATYAPYIYLVCGLVALYQLYRLTQVRADRRQAVFSLERERALRELYGIFTVAMVLLLVMGITYFSSITLPKASVAGPSPQETLPPEFSLQIVPTNTPLPATPSATPTATITPVPPTAIADRGSANGTSHRRPLRRSYAYADTAASRRWPRRRPPAPTHAHRSPRRGTVRIVSGVFTLIGTATHEQFGFYKVEFAPGANATGGFTYLADGRGPVFGGALANVDTRGLSNGPWTFQLTVVDQTSNYPDPCRVTVNVQN